MCGLSGEFNFKGVADVAAVARMTANQVHRGPDASGIFAQDEIALGHRRLSIIDLSGASQQPFVDQELGLTAVFNGCIYNYKELRAELRDRGYRFCSAGDTEVLLKSYHAWGLDCVHRFFGMFAFAIWERDRRRLVIGRDRLGIKPLYLARTPKFLRFASTLPALLASSDDIDKSIDSVGLHNYMSLHAVVPADRTILRGIRRLSPGTVAVIEKHGAVSEHRYWSPRPTGAAEHGPIAREEWIERTDELLRRSVARRLVADVPTGVLLSGGLDSSLVVALAAQIAGQPVKTYSIGFQSVKGVEGDEFRYSRRVAQEFATDHQEISVDSSEALAALPDVIASMSEPMMSHDAIGFFLLSREVSKDIKVVQSGQGADEVFAGYHWYPKIAASSKPAEEYIRHYFDRDHEEMKEVLAPDYLGDDHSRDFVERYFADLGEMTALDKALQIDTDIMLVDDPVKRVDNMTMAFGVEARVPFLDHELVELATRMPADLKLPDGGKYVLKEFARSVLPAEIIDRPKGYFPVPGFKYLEGPILDYAKQILWGSGSRGIINPSYVSRLLQQPDEALTPKGHSKLWQIFVLEHWLQTHGV